MARRGGRSGKGGRRGTPPARDPKAALAQKLDRALALHQAGDHGAALRLYDEAARALPGNSRLWLTIATVATAHGEGRRARNALHRAALIDPVSLAAWVNLSSAALDADDKTTAEAAARRALITGPLEIAAHNNLARSLVGVHRLDSLDRATRRGAVLAPAHPQPLMARLLWAHEAGRPDLIVTSARRGLALVPTHSVFLSNLGAAQVQRGEREAAEQAYRRAVVADPGFAAAWYNLGNFRDHEGAAEAAISAHDRASLLAPDNGDHHFNRAMALLLAGRFREGLEAFERRWSSAAQTTDWQSPGAELWDGRALNGERVLVWAEQGLGDTIQFSRYLHFVRDRGGVPELQVQPELASLLRHCPLAETVHAQGQDLLPDPPFHLPLLSLPHLAGSTPDNVPPPTPLTDLPPPIEVARAEGALNVGLVWSGNPKHRRDAERSIPLAALAPLAEVPGIRLHVLQHGPARDQIAACGFADRLTQHAPTADLLDATRLIRAMDLVLTVDTALAHLSGTLGVKTWILITHHPDWRWQRARRDSIWYESVRLYRQDAWRDWGSVVDDLVGDLRGVAG